MRGKLKAELTWTPRHRHALFPSPSAIDSVSFIHRLVGFWRRTDFQQLARFFDGLPKPIDHVLVTGPGPYYAPLAELDFEKARRHVETHLLLPLHVARNALGKVLPGGTFGRSHDNDRPVYSTKVGTSRPTIQTAPAFSPLS